MSEIRYTKNCYDPFFNTNNFLCWFTYQYLYHGIWNEED